MKNKQLHERPPFLLQSGGSAYLKQIHVIQKHKAAGHKKFNEEYDMRFEVAGYALIESVFAVVNDAVSANATLISFSTFLTIEVQFRGKERRTGFGDGAFHDYGAIGIQDPEAYSGD